MVEIKSYQITQVKPMGKNVKIYILKSKDGTTLAFKPGQFVNLYLKEDGKFSTFRQFSIASKPGVDYLEFCIKISSDGKFTPPLDKLPLGAEIGVAGPFGHFVYAEQNKCAFIAAGTGIAPMLSMLRYIADKKTPGNYTLLYTNKTKDRILYYEELKELEKQHPNIRVICTVTQETPINWNGETGRINPEMVKKYIDHPQEYMWYFCGPVEFVKTIKEQALNHGAQPQNIKIEGWG